jgi:hypothetical protein
MNDSQLERLSPLLADLYWSTKTAREDVLMRTLWLALGFDDPLYGQHFRDRPRPPIDRRFRGD